MSEGWRVSLQRAWWATETSGWSRALAPLAGLYRLLLASREAAYRFGWRRSHRLPVPVIVVGNLIVGGAGKTPTVIALVHALRRRGWTPGVVSRGHGSSPSASPHPVDAQSRAAQVGDEPLLIHRRTAAPVWVGRRRADAGRALLAANPQVDVILADDGLQHRALARDAQVVVFDHRGVGNGLLLPAGPLREAMAPDVPPRTAVLYNAEHASTPWPGALAARRLGLLLPLRAWWAGDTALALDIGQLSGRRVLAAAGIGEPERFFSLLHSAGLATARLPLPDHAPLTPRPWRCDDWDFVVVTEKDAVKIPADAPDNGAIVVATLDFTVPETLVDSLCGWLPPCPPRHP